MRVVPHPAEGSVVTIEPLRTLEEVARVEAILDCPRDRGLFALGVNTALRATDLLAVRADDIDWMRGVLCLREKKTKKKRTVPLNSHLLSLLAPLIPPDGVGYLFPSEKTGKPLSLSAWNNKIKLWCIRANLRGNYGARMIRKTFARLQHEVFGVSIMNISMELNHSSLRETYLYICVTPPEQAEIFSNYIGGPV